MTRDTINDDFMSYILSVACSVARAVGQRRKRSQVYHTCWRAANHLQQVHRVNIHTPAERKRQGA